MSNFLMGWVRRAFLGGDGARTEHPGRLRLKKFFRRKLAVAALVVLVGLFAFSFFAPKVMPLRLNDTNGLQSNLAPNYSMRKVPKKLKGNIRSIDGFSGFTVGVSTDGRLFLWGDLRDRLTGDSYARVPEQAKNDVALAAAGVDHLVAITKDGEIVCWGNNGAGQFGDGGLNAVPMPTSLKEEGVRPEDVSRLCCGYQATAIVKTDGGVYAWGNANTVLNLRELTALGGVEKLVFSGFCGVAMKKDGSVTTGEREYFTSAVSSFGNPLGKSLKDYLQDKKAVDIAATDYCLCVVCDDGDVVVSGAFENGEDELPVLLEGEKFVSVSAGSRHFVAITNRFRAYSWGGNAYGQASFQGVEKVDKAFCGAAQSYLVSGGRLVKSFGLKGYLMGTDGQGRDVFTRIAHGGKTTLTIGAVAVIFSTVVAVIVGCIAGYFGGKVDVVLMRITEIFSSIPFLPFAMLLSSVIRHYPVTETTRVFLIMLVLGALSWTGLARIIRGQILSEREKEFVIAARAMGVKEGTIAFRHVLPNILSVVLVNVTLDFAGCLLTESALSYLGFGVQQPRPTWGNMLTGAINALVIQNYWWQWLFPAVFLMLATICINVIGDALRDAVDPKSSVAKG